MRRVAITGLGIVSCLGNDPKTVTEALRNGHSGIRFNDAFAEAGLRSQVCGSVAIDTTDFIDRKAHRFMGDAAAYAHIALQQAIGDAGLGPGEVSNERTGVIAGSGGGEEEHWSLAMMFDAMGALSSRRNDRPETASRPYDADRDGFVIAAGVQEAIHCLLMMEHGFMAGSANIDDLDPRAADLPVLTSSRDSESLDTVMSNNFGFGGTNACLVFRRTATP